MSLNVCVPANLTSVCLSASKGLTPPCFSASRYTGGTEEPSQRVGEGKTRCTQSAAQDSYDEWHVWCAGKQEKKNPINTHDNFRIINASMHLNTNTVKHGRNYNVPIDCLNKKNPGIVPKSARINKWTKAAQYILWCNSIELIRRHIKHSNSERKTSVKLWFKASCCYVFSKIKHLHY